MASDEIEPRPIPRGAPGHELCTHGSSLLEANQEVVIGQKGGLSGTEHPGNSAGSAPAPKGSLSEEVQQSTCSRQG